MVEPLTGTGVEHPPVWVAPEWRPDEPPAPTVTRGDEPAPASRGPARGRERPTVPFPLRPLSAGERIDGGLRILKLAPGTVLSLAVLAVVPVHLLSAFVLGDVPSRGALADAALGRPMASLLLEDVGGVPVALLLVAAESIGLSFATAGIASLLAAWHTGRQPGTVEVLSEAAGRLPVLVAAWSAVHVAEAVFALGLVVGALVPMAVFAVVVPVIAVEGAGPIAALRRSYDLARRAFGLVLGTCLAVAAVDHLLRFTLAITTSAADDLDFRGETVLVSAMGIAVRLLTVPFVAGCAALLYLDLRVRLEGLDIEVAAGERFPDGR